MMLKQFLLLVSISLALGLDKLNQEEFGNEALSAHNIYRRVHGVEPVRLNANLSQIAFKRATELATLGELNVKQNFLNGVNLGETVGSVGGFAEYNGISATQLWYSVVNKYDEEGETSDEGASFTQIVWKSTQEVGFGIAKSKDGKFFFVAEYFPSGNIRGQYENNVFQLTDELLDQSTTPVRPVPCMNTTVTEVWTKVANKTQKKLIGQNEFVIRPSEVVEQDGALLEIAAPVVKPKVVKVIQTTTPKVVEVEVEQVVPEEVVPEVTTVRVLTSTKVRPAKTTTESFEESFEQVETTTERPITIIQHQNRISVPKKLGDMEGEIITFGPSSEDFIETTTARPVIKVKSTTPLVHHKKVTTTTITTTTTTEEPVTQEQEEVEIQTTEPEVVEEVTSTTVKSSIPVDEQEDRIVSTTARVVLKLTTTPEPVVVTEEVTEVAVTTEEVITEPVTEVVETTEAPVVEQEEVILTEAPTEPEERPIVRLIKPKMNKTVRKSSEKKAAEKEEQKKDLGLQSIEDENIDPEVEPVEVTTSPASTTIKPAMKRSRLFKKKNLKNAEFEKVSRDNEEESEN